jgi:hypothetical protein
MLAPLTNLPDDKVSGNGGMTASVEDDEAAGDALLGEDEVCVSPPPYSVCQLVLSHMCYAYLSIQVVLVADNAYTAPYSVGPCRPYRDIQSEVDKA